MQDKRNHKDSPAPHARRFEKNVNVNQIFMLQKTLTNKDNIFPGCQRCYNCLSSFQVMPAFFERYIYYI
jgi:hypothetical protein